MDELNRRLRAASPEQLKQFARDANEPAVARTAALARLEVSELGHPVVPLDPEVPDILLGLLGDPDPEARRMALQCSSSVWFDPRVVERVHSLLDDPDVYVHVEAATVLAMRHDETVLPYLLRWFHGDDQPHRNAATQGLRLLDTPESRRVLREGWAQGGRSEEDRIGLAMTLLMAGDPCGVPLLKDVARRADSDWSCAAAEILYHSAAHQTDSLELMREILDRGSLEAKRHMVGWISNRSWPRLSHAFTADGIHEARCWIDQQLQAGASRTVG
jgi:HEAT repeat protein